MDHSQVLDDVFESTQCPETGLVMPAPGRSPARSLESMDRKKAYFLLMGTCILLIVVAWNIVRFWSTTAAVVMSAVAAVIPPIAVIVGNWDQDRQ
jgi:Protein of unknown function (DUF3099)